MSFYTQKSSKYNRPNRSKKYPPFVNLLFTFFIILLFVYGIPELLGDNIIHGYSRIIKISVILTLIEIPFLFQPSLNYIVKPTVEKTKSNEEKQLIPLISLIAIPAIIFGINLQLSKAANMLLDFSKPEIYYFKIIKSYSERETKTNKRGKTSVYFTHYISFSSLTPGETFTRKISVEESAWLIENDVLKLTVKSGLFGVPYYKKLSHDLEVDSNLFPKNTVFPVREDKAKVLMEEKKQQDIQKGLNEKREKERQALEEKKRQRNEFFKKHGLDVKKYEWTIKWYYQENQ